MAVSHCLTWRLIFVACLFSSAAVLAQSVSFSRSDFTTQPNPIAAATGDFNQDGKPDLAIANWGANSVSVFLGNPDGTFALKSTLATGANPRAVAVGDFNQDGKPDLAVANFNGMSVSVFLGSGDGTFISGASLLFTNNPTSVAIGNIKQDGKLDLVIAEVSQSSGSLTVALGNGDGTFSFFASTVGAELSPFSEVVADLNNDGKLDVAIANSNSSTVSVLLGDGTGLIHSTQTLATGFQPWTIAAADLNGDGKLDLVTTSFSAPSASVLLGNGDGTFGTHTEFSAGPTPRSIAIADFNGDGKIDLAAANETVNSVSLLAGNGDGTFGPPVAISVSQPTFVVSGEFSGDAKPDLATVSFAVNQGSILTNTTAFAPSGGSFVKHEFTTGLSPSSIISGDFNGDGKLDVAFANGPENNTVSVLLGDGKGSFFGRNDYTTDMYPRLVATADFNGDGKLDLVMASRDTTSLSVLIGNGDGTFNAKADVLAHLFAYSIATGDFNRDGKVDLVVASCPSNSVEILLGSGDGTFFSNGTLPVDECPFTVVTGDFNRDGKLDLATGNFGLCGQDSCVSTTSILLGNGDGTFGPRTDLATGGDRPLFALTGDFNRDGELDLVFGNDANGSTSILLGNGDGSFQTKNDLAGNIVTLSGDFNRDGKLDLAPGDGRFFGTGPILLGNGDGTFVPSILMSISSATRSTTTGDFNGDGKLDFAAANFNSSFFGIGTVSVLLNAPPSANTPAGSNAAVNLLDATAGTTSASLIFSNVTQAGTTTFTVSSGGPPPPSGFKLGNPPIYFGLTTTAVFSGPVKVCINYSGISFGNESALKLFHFENTAWVDATTSLDTVNNIICATVTSFSAFGIFEPAVVPVQIDIKPGGFPNSIKLSSQGNIPVAILSSSTFNAPANVDKTSLTFGRTGNEKSFVFCDSSIKDVNHDKRPDLVCYFVTGLTGFQLTDTVGILKGKSVNGTLIQGSDSVRIVP